jgi:hypothetical protein
MPMNTSFIKLYITVAVLSFASGCTSEQLYNTGQAWQNGNCEKIADQDVRKRCLDAGTSYDDYKRQTEDRSK